MVCSAASDNAADHIDVYKSLLLTVISTVLTTLIFVAVFELVASKRYDKWKEDFQESPEFYGMLTKASDNRTLLWEYRPSFAGEYLGTPIVTNAHGFRDAEHSLENSNGNYRVAFVGDSVTVGVGVQLEETFTRRFEEIANAGEPEPAVEALSISIDGYTGIQVLELAREKALPFSPSLVVYVLCMNDFDFVRSSGQKRKYFEKPRSFFLRVINRAYFKVLGGDYYRSAYKNNGATVLSDVVNTGRILGSEGMEFVVVLMPTFGKIENGDSYPLIWLHQEITAALVSQSVQVIDLLPELQQFGELADFGMDEIHLNQVGHELVAETLVDQLL
jgi:lysophospholipase L1-like esterase